jgi:hypothetical protein
MVESGWRISEASVGRRGSVWPISLSPRRKRDNAAFPALRLFARGFARDEAFQRLAAVGEQLRAKEIRRRDLQAS